MMQNFMLLSHSELADLKCARIAWTITGSETCIDSRAFCPVRVIPLLPQMRKKYIVTFQSNKKIDDLISQ